jgi:hypothetical protein
VSLGLANATPAGALITPPVTVDGPSSEILGFGGVAMASDGSGGLVYLKAVEGTPHVFASRYVGGRWSAPLRVDSDQPFAASQPRIAAGPRGELLAVWVTKVATVHGKVQYALFSARVGANGSSFGRSLLVDPNVGEGIGVAPSLAAVSPGKAIVAYRTITFTFPPDTFSTAVQLRPGDVMADIRLARLNGDRWSRLGTINRNPEASMRPPSATNAPQVGVGAEGNAVVAWQEPDQSGAARIWMRRVFGTTPGPILQASPSSWEGRLVSADADALSLSVTPYAQARVAIRIAPTAGSALAGRLLLNSLPANYSTTAGTLSGPQLADGGAAPAVGGAGPPDVAVGEDSSRKASMRLDFLAGTQLRQMGLGSDSGVVEVAAPPGPPAQAGAEPVTAVNPEGGGMVAYPALDVAGQAAVAVRQEFPSGAAQTGLVSGVQGGPISGLAIGRSGTGDGLVAFLQGEAGHFEVVAERVSAPPASFRVRPPKGWSKPNAVKLRWQAAESTVGGVRYSVLIDGRTIKGGLRRRVFRPRPAQLGNGLLRTQILATDGSGQQLLSGAAKLRVDGQRPVAKVRARQGGEAVLRLADSGSGLDAKASRVSFGDGERARGGSRFAHAYRRPGRYTIVVRARDRVGNRLWRRFPVRIG